MTEDAHRTHQAAPSRVSRGGSSCSPVEYGVLVTYCVTVQLGGSRQRGKGHRPACFGSVVSTTRTFRTTLQPIPGFVPHRNALTCLSRYTYKNVHKQHSPESYETGKRPVSINGKRESYTGTQSCGGMSHSGEGGCTTASPNNVGATHRHRAEPKTRTRGETRSPIPLT